MSDEVTMSEAVRKYRVNHQNNPSACRDLRTGPAEKETEVRTFFYSLPNMNRLVMDGTCSTHVAGGKCRRRVT